MVITNIPFRTKILYVGTLQYGSTTLQRLNALWRLGCDITEIDTTYFFGISIIDRIFYRLFRQIDRCGANKKIKDALAFTRYDVLWIDKGLTIKSDTLRYVKFLQPDCLIVGYSPDDMTGNKRNQSRRFLSNLPFYDLFVTTKSYCVEELKKLGCKEVLLIGNAFDEEIHRPIAVSDEERKRFGGPVGFIGQWEPQRAASLYAVARAGVPVRVWGYTWERCKYKHPNLILENRPLWAEDYTKAICSFDINLCFLRKANRDLQTTRSIEIPACGAFMLAERTNEHLELFEEGKEAEFFSSDEELVDKVRYYLKHDDKRKQIAAAGRERCLKSGYGNSSRMKTILEKIMTLKRGQKT